VALNTVIRPSADRHDIAQSADLNGCVGVIGRSISKLAKGIPTPGPYRAVGSQGQVVTLARRNGDYRIQVANVPGTVHPERHKTIVVRDAVGRGDPAVTQLAETSLPQVQTLPSQSSAIVCLPPPQTCLMGEGGRFVFASASGDSANTANATKVPVWIPVIGTLRKHPRMLVSPSFISGRRAQRVPPRD